MMHSFLQYVARDIMAKHPEGLSDVAIVFPNKRASLFLNQALCEVAGRPLWSPAYITISDLFRQHSALSVPDQMLLVFKLYNTFCEVMGTDEPLDQFYSWGQLLLSDFDDIDKNMADASKLFVNLEAWQGMRDFSFLTEQQRQSLEAFFGTVMDETEMQRRFNDLWRYLADIYTTYRQNLHDEGLAYEGMLYREVAEQDETPFRYKTYIFIGFNLLQKVEQRLFSRLHDMGRAEFYWDYDAYYMKPGNEAGKYIANYLDRFPNELSRTHISAGLDEHEIYHAMTEPKDVTYVSAPTENIQARYIADWLREGSRMKDGSRTAIVLGDEKLLETVVHCLPPEVDNVNITTGFPLSSSPVSQLVNDLMALQLNGRVSRSDRYRLKQVKQVLLNPYARYISEDCAGLMNELREHKQYFPDRKTLTEGRDEAMAALFADIQPVNGHLPLLPWLVDMLKRVGIGAQEDRNPLLQECIFRMYTLINRLDEIMIPVTPDAPLTATAIDPESGKQLVSTAILSRLLTQVIQSTSVPFHGEPLLGIQIMGVLETRNLDFDHVLVLSCNEGNLPRSVNDVSFIPHSLRAGFELTTVENKVAIFAYYFHALLQRAGDVTLVYNDSVTTGKQAEMSRFMLQYMVDNAHRQPIRRCALQSSQSVTPIRRRAIAKTERVMEQLNAIERLSPSAINRYLRCPLQFYYNTLCHLREQEDDDEEDVNNVTFGNIFHYAAELIYRELSDNGQHPVTAEAITALRRDRIRMERHLDQAFREKLFKVTSETFKPHYNGLQRLNKKVIRLYLERMLELDRQLAPFDILALEESFYDNLTFDVGGRKRTLEVGGQIDRLDKVTRGGSQVIRVVDYKTGAPLKSYPADMAAVFDPRNVDTKHSTYYLQAFLYSGIIRYGEKARTSVNQAGLPVSPALFFIRQSATPDYDPTLCFKQPHGKEEPIRDIEDHYEEFWEMLQNLVGEIMNPEIPFGVTVDDKRCLTCPYAGICGI
jgi:RecB family exonuclease